MKTRVHNAWGFFKTTALGGLLFLLPLFVLGWLLGSVYHAVVVIYEPLKTHLPVSGVVGTALLFGLAVILLVLLCAICGLAARRAIARRFSQTVEKQIMMLYPKYAIYKDILTGNFGGDAHVPTLKPAAVQLQDMVRVGYEAGRTEQGLVIVYLPGSPDPWMGAVALVEPSRVQPLELEFGEVSALCERLGRDSERLLAAVRRDMCAEPPSP
jgi:uncharacterized membrane protein